MKLAQFPQDQRFLKRAALLASSLATVLTLTAGNDGSSGWKLTACLLAQESAPSVPPSTKRQTEFLRIKMNGQVPASLDTAVVTYRTGAPENSGVEVDLIGAVHVGEAAYYDELNRLFDQYDVLLYELVAPEGTVIPAGGKRERGGFNPVAMLQDSAKDMLGLESQLECVDYTKAHFVRADMTPTQISEKMAERGDTPFTLALSTLADVMRQQNLSARKDNSVQPDTSLDEIGLVDMLGNPLKMKRVLAAQFAQTGSLEQALGGPLNQLLVVDRNAAAIQVLQKQIAAGKKKIGIFYGAAHLPDLEKHLIDDFGLTPSNQRWLAAWDLQSAKEPQLSEPATLLFNLLKRLE